MLSEGPAYILEWLERRVNAVGFKGCLAPGRSKSPRSRAQTPQLLWDLPNAPTGAALNPSIRPQIYFHAPCFDGIASAVLVWDFLERAQGWSDCHLKPINYGAREVWLNTVLSPRSAVVDYLFHPNATFWADHHATTFLSKSVEAEYAQHRTPWRVYDESASSCADLLYAHLWRHFSYQNTAYEDLVKWSVTTDSARYRSVAEALWGDAAALRLNHTLGYGDSNEYSLFLVAQLRNRPLEEVADLPRVKERYARYEHELQFAMDVVRKFSYMDDEVAVLDVPTEGVFVPRYAVYHYYPQAAYSVGIVRRGGRAFVTAMANPWRDFRGPHLGRLFEQMGGGGHPRVGSVVVDESDTDVRSVVTRVIKTLKTGGVPAEPVSEVTPA